MLDWKIGVECELLAPRGLTRRDYAERLAADCGGSVRRVLFPQSEPSLVPGTPVFYNLVLGFDVYDTSGQRIARCVDDLTIQADLDREAPSRPGWFRVLSDDARLLRLLERHGDPDATLEVLLDPVGQLFGTVPTTDDGTIYRLADASNASLMLAATLPGERERPCELISEPISSDHRAKLKRLLAPAHELDFLVPQEAAVHIHFDASRIRDAPVFRRLVKLISRFGPELRQIVETNPRCVRLGPPPAGLAAIVDTPDFDGLDWQAVLARLSEIEFSKYVDFNLLNVVADVPGKATLEVRILPGSMDPDLIVDQACLFAAILDHCRQPDAAAAEFAEAGQFAAFIAALDFEPEAQNRWTERLNALPPIEASRPSRLQRLARRLSSGSDR